MQEDFYIVLLSNSSQSYFPENKSTHFVTKLPKHINLQGDWAVALIDIHVPLNFQNVPKEEESRCMIYERINKYIKITGADITKKVYIPPGNYKNFEDLIRELNVHTENSHIEFSLKSGSYVAVRKNCGNDELKKCNGYVEHSLQLCQSLRQILGFQSRKIGVFSNVDILSDFPANLHAALPSNLLVYTDICQPYITGDAYTKLLRNVPLDLGDYTYGRTLSVDFSRPLYIPLLCTSFETVEILIRSEIGQKVLIDHGTVTLTLHFKRVSS